MNPFFLFGAIAYVQRKGKEKDGMYHTRIVLTKRTIIKLSIAI